MRTRTLCAAALLVFASSAGAIEIQAPSAGCGSADTSAGKSLWKQIDKAADGSEVVLTNTENRQLWCYNDSLHNADAPTDKKAAGPNFGLTPEKALAVHITTKPDPDADHDGVPDAKDSCAGSPAYPDSTSAKPVGANGCTK